jgi:site-specific DNA recombinase
MPREEWIEIPVPSIVDPAVFEATRVQLEENRKRKRERARGQCWLLQGLTVCRCCGYAYYGKTAPRSRKYDPMNALRYYRCTGADGYRFSGKAVCHNGPVRGDQLEQAVWDQVRALLEEPHRVAGEYRRRITQARDGAAMPEEIVRLDRQITSLRRGIGRLIDSYTEGVIDKTEFEPRIVGLRQRLSQLQERHQAALEAAETERDLALVISRLEDFSAKVSKASTISIELACRTSSEPSYAGSKSTTAASRLSSGSHHQMVHRDQDHQPKQPILGNIVQALTVHRLGST